MDIVAHPPMALYVAATSETAALNMALAETQPSIAGLAAAQHMDVVTALRRPMDTVELQTMGMFNLQKANHSAQYTYLLYIPAAQSSATVAVSTDPAVTIPHTVAMAVIQHTDVAIQRLLSHMYRHLLPLNSPPELRRLLRHQQHLFRPEELRGTDTVVQTTTNTFAVASLEIVAVNT